MSFDVIVQQLVNGVTLGGMYALIALGYTLVYGILLMINFAHSEMFMGRRVRWSRDAASAHRRRSHQTVSDKLPFLSFLETTQAFFTGSTFGLIVLFLIIFGVAMVAIGILGVVIERVAYRPLRHAPRLAPLISAIGVSIFLQNAVLLWVDSKAIPYPQVFPVEPVVTIGGASINTLQVLIIITSIVLLVILDTFVSQDEDRQGDARDLAGPRGSGPHGHRHQLRHRHWRSSSAPRSARWPASSTACTTAP